MSSETGQVDVLQATKDAENRIVPDVSSYGEYKKIASQRLAASGVIVDRERKARFWDRWKIDEGYYGSHFIPGSPDASSRYDEPLYGDEEIIDMYIDDALNSDRHKDGTPVVFIDFGAGLGLSAIRIAASRRSLIESGQLKVIATNLVFEPETEEDSRGYTGIARILAKEDKYACSKEEIDFIQQNQSLVTFLQSTATELTGASVTQEGGNDLPLLGNVDVVHEQMALRHSHIPDIDIPALGRLLGSEGTLILGLFLDPHPTYSPIISTNDGTIIDTQDPDYVQGREVAFEVGLRVLEFMGFSREPGRFGDGAIFRNLRQ